MYRLKSFFRGRYGFRGISIPLAVIAALIILYTLLFPSVPNGEMRILMAAVLLGVVLFRAMSRNIDKNKSLDMMFGYMLQNIKARFGACLAFPQRRSCAISSATACAR